MKLILSANFTDLYRNFSLKRQQELLLPQVQPFSILMKPFVQE
jgi:hypothetical protein